MTDERFSLAIKQKNALEALIRSEGWEIISTIIADQIELRRNAFELTPLENFLEAGKQEYSKGEIAAFRLTLKMPSDIIEDAVEIIDQLTPDEEKEDGEETSED